MNQVVGKKKPRPIEKFITTLPPGDRQLTVELEKLPCTDVLPPKKRLVGEVSTDIPKMPPTTKKSDQFAQLKEEVKRNSNFLEKIEFHIQVLTQQNAQILEIMSE